MQSRCATHRTVRRFHDDLYEKGEVIRDMPGGPVQGLGRRHGTRGDGGRNAAETKAATPATPPKATPVELPANADRPGLRRGASQFARKAMSGPHFAGLFCEKEELDELSDLCGQHPRHLCRPPATFDATGYAALTYTTIGEITDLGEFGREYNLVTHNPVATRSTSRRRAFNEGAMTLQLAIDEADAGQVLPRPPTDPTTTIQLQADHCRAAIVYYFRAQVMSFKKLARQRRQHLQRHDHAGDHHQQRRRRHHPGSVTPDSFPSPSLPLEARSTRIGPFVLSFVGRGGPVHLPRRKMTWVSISRPHGRLDDRRASPEGCRGQSAFCRWPQRREAAGDVASASVPAPISMLERAPLKPTAASSGCARRARSKLSADETKPRIAPTSSRRSPSGFDNLDYPEGVPVQRPEQFQAVFSDREIGFIADQVRAYVGDWENFTKSSATS
jgi:hypothetical protein